MGAHVRGAHEPAGEQRRAHPVGEAGGAAGAHRGSVQVALQEEEVGVLFSSC